MKIVPYRVATDKYEAEILKAFQEVLRSGMFVLGEKTLQFEKNFAASHGRKYAVSVNSDTAALEAALTMIGEKDRRKDTVLIPDAAFFGCANVALKMGYDVGVVDCSLTNGIMPTLEQLKRSVDEFLELDNLIYMAVYTAGTVGIDAVEQIEWCRKYGIPVIEDCAHCHGARYKDGRLVGSAGDISTFSFYATKIVHCGEGGILLVDDEEQYKWLKTYRNYGKAWGPNEDPVFADCEMIGYNWRMTEFQAALADILWKHFDEIKADRKKVADVYDKVCKDPASAKMIYRLPVHVGMQDSLLEPNLYKYIAIVPALRSKAQNHALSDWLKARGVNLQAKCNSYPLSGFKVYEDKIMKMHLECQDAALYSMSHIALPIYPSMTVEQAEYVIENVVAGIKEVVL